MISSKPRKFSSNLQHPGVVRCVPDHEPPHGEEQRRQRRCHFETGKRAEAHTVQDTAVAFCSPQNTPARTKSRQVTSRQAGLHPSDGFPTDAPCHRKLSMHAIHPILLDTVASRFVIPGASMCLRCLVQVRVTAVVTAPPECATSQMTLLQNGWLLEYRTCERPNDINIVRRKADDSCCL